MRDHVQVMLRLNNIQHDELRTICAHTLRKDEQIDDVTKRLTLDTAIIIGPAWVPKDLTGWNYSTNRHKDGRCIVGSEDIIDRRGAILCAIVRVENEDDSENYVAHMPKTPEDIHQTSQRVGACLVGWVANRGKWKIVAGRTQCEVQSSATSSSSRRERQGTLLRAAACT